MWDGQFSDHESSMTEYAVRIPMGPMRALRIIADAINNPDLLHDMVYHAFQAQVPDWAEHGWELHAVAGMAEVIVTARRKA